MRKILVPWSAMHPMESYSYGELCRSYPAFNYGNLVFTNSVLRTLMVDEETQFLFFPTARTFSPGEIEKINAECDCVVMMLANAINPSYAPVLPGLTKLVRALRIPCHLLSIGGQEKYDPEPGFRHPFDADVRRFIAALLDRTEIVGTRGEITADYLGRLGFRAEKDYTVVGCPSLYTYGGELPLRSAEVALGAESKVCFNLTPSASSEQMRFVRNNFRALPNAAYIPQDGWEMRLLYYGAPRELRGAQGYPKELTDEMYARGNARIFARVAPWIEYMRTRDLCCGTRMHGNICAVLAGTPTVFLPIDSRMRELVEYHGFAQIPPDSVRADADLRDWVERLDFAEPVRRHARNFAHYVDFLDRIGVRHIFHEPDGGVVYDRRMAALDPMPPLEYITRAQPEEIARRLEQYHEELAEQRRRDRNPTLCQEARRFARAVKRKLRGLRKRG